MIIGDNSHRNIVIDILGKSFDDNLSVNYIVKQDKRRQERIKYLMEFCFDICLKGGRIYLPDDEKACALIQLPELKKNSLIDDVCC